MSLVSASSVIEKLDPEKYEVIPVGITKEGRWIAGPESMQLLKSGRAPSESNALIKPEPPSRAGAVGGLGKIDVVFPVLHGPYGEDGTVQGFLELAGLPYVGCGVLGSSVCMDKVMQKKILALEGIRQVAYEWFWSSEWEKEKPRILETESLAYPLFVKPANMGSSVGISKVRNAEELEGAVAEAMRYDRKIIIERGVLGAREIEVALLGSRRPRASVPGEVISSNEFYDYDAKYVDGASRTQIPAKLARDLVAQIQDTAIRAYKALDCEGMARADFLLAEDGGELYLNEVNTIPGFTSISMYPKLWEASGIGYAELLDELIRLALARAGEKERLLVSYKPKSEWYAL